MGDLTIITDMGRHAIYVWPAFGAFAAIFALLFIWVWVTGARARALLERLESQRKSPDER